MREYTSYGWRDDEKRVAYHWGVSLDLDKPTTGVVSNNAIEYLSDACLGSDAIDLAWQEHLEECKGECQAPGDGRHRCHCNHDGGKCHCYGVAEHEYDPDEGEHDGCGPQEHGTVLIGSWKKIDDKWEPDPDAKDAEYAAIVGEIYTQVLWSKTIVRVRDLCSPCYPGQADVDPDKIVTEGGYLAYDLPVDMYGERE